MTPTKRQRIRYFIQKFIGQFNCSSREILLVFFLGGIVFWGGFNTVMEATNTESFCISCHEMEENVYQEYKSTIHFSNRTGVRATCPDCHVPKDWVHKFIRKVSASNELFHKIIGSVDTPEKFNRKRPQLAQHVWQAMEDTDSRECRNCHSFNSMDVKAQRIQAQLGHKRAITENKTCIHCHKGISHKLPIGYKDFAASDEEHERYHNEGVICFECHEGMAHTLITDDWDKDE